MKRIYSFMVAAVAIFAAVSCNKELEQGNLPAGETVTFEAVADGVDAKAVLDGTTSKWVSGDKITVHNGNKGYEFSTTDEGVKAIFSYTGSDFSGDRFMAVYPAGNYTADLASKTVNAYIPTWQQAQKGTYHKDAALAVAYTDNASLAFKNAAALLKFTVNTDNVTHVVFHGNNSEAVTGNVKVVLGSEGVESVECLETEFTEEKWNETEQKNEEVKVNKYGTWVECYAYHDDADKYFVKGETYYIAVAPQVFEGGVTVKVRIDDGEELVAKTTTNRVATKASTILNLGEISYEAPVVHEWAIAGTFNGWNATANPMELVDGYYVAKNITGLEFTANPDPENTSSDTGFKFVNKGSDWKGGEGKVTAGTWAYVWNDNGANIYVDGAETSSAYDIYLNPTPDAGGGIKFVVVTAGAKMPEDVVVEEEVVVEYWAAVGTMNNWADLNKMELEGDWHVAKDVKLLASDQFKFRANGTWDLNRGAAADADGVTIENDVETAVVSDGKNFCVSEGGFYSLYINKSATKAKVVKTADLPVESVPDQPSDWALWAETGTTWEQIEMVTTTVPELFVAKSVTLEEYKSFLVKPSANWNTKYGAGSINYIDSNHYFTATENGDNISVDAAGTYDIYFDINNKYIYLMTTGTAYTSATLQKNSGDGPPPAGVPVEPNHIYLKPGNNWSEASAHFAAWVWKSGSEGKVYNFTKHASVDGIYEIEVPAGADNMILFRLDPKVTLAEGSTTWPGDNHWYKSGDIKITGNMYTVIGWHASGSGFSTVDTL